MMAERDRKPDVVGSAEIQRLLGIGRERVYQLAQRPDFPPFTQLAIGRVWDRAAVIAWDQDRKAPGKRGRSTVLRSYGKTGSITRAAKAAGVSRRTARRWLDELGRLD